MKTMKKLFALLLALVMTMSMATSAFAATIIIDDGTISDATYQAYKLLNATDGGDGKFAYTVNTKYEAVLQEVTSKTSDADIVAYISNLKAEDIRDFADAVYAEIVEEELAADYTTNTNKFEDVGQGYYLIAETATGNTPETMGDDTYSLVMLDTAGKEDITVVTKESIPTVEKKVEEKNDTTGESSWGDSADYDVGDTINYTITGTVSDKIANYKTYSYVITDTMDPGLTYNGDAKVYVVNGDSKVDVTEQFKIEETTNGFTVSANLKELTGVTISATTKIVVEYSATLNEEAVSGSAGNKNTVKLTYNRNPYYDGTGTPETGDTPEDTNVVFTYDVIVDKVDNKGNALEGAGFTLYKEVDGAWVQVGNEITGETTFEFEKLDEGKYKLVETTVPAGYNKAADVEFEIVSTLEGTKLTALTVTPAGSFTVTLESGKIETDIVNNAGTELPETGGVGTTIFYTLGGILVLAAIVLLVTKKRMASAE